MGTNTRLRINLNAREVEWDGSEDFINKYESIITEFLDILKNQPQQKADTDHLPELKPSNNNQEQNGEILVPQNFGEFYLKFPRGISVTDKMLISGYFLQVKGPEGLFTPGEAAGVLKEQGVNVTNPNAFISSLVTSGKIFKVSGKCKVSEKGVEQLVQMLKQNNN